MPSLHGSGADAPSGQYEPGAHTWHSVPPDAFMNLPAAQLSHLGCLLLGCTVPALHGVCAVLPVGAKWPASVAVHSSALLHGVMRMRRGVRYSLILFFAIGSFVRSD